MSDYQTTPAPTSDHRTLGFFPLSVATSLALEGLVNIHPDLPPAPRMPLKQYDDVWVNLRTLCRNIHNACDRGVQDDMTPGELAHLLVEEMAVIPDMLKEYNGGPFTVNYYLSDHSNLDRKYPHAKFRTRDTEIQKLTDGLMHDTLEMMKAYLRNNPGAFFHFRDKITPHTTTNSLILTHIAYDLLAAKNFDKLSLLESHTGRIKPSSSFYTKYYKGKDLPMIPFMVEFMQVFGDSEIFAPMDKKLRDVIKAIAQERKWSNVTTMERVKLGLGELQNPAHKLIMKQIFGALV